MASLRARAGSEISAGLTNIGSEIGFGLGVGGESGVSIGPEAKSGSLKVLIQVLIGIY